MPFGEKLKQYRASQGFESARSFYNGYLAKRANLDFNYSYYVKIENGEVTPSAQVISRITSCFDDSVSNDLTLAYCQDLFPKKQFLFQGSALPSPQAKPSPTPRPKAEPSHKQQHVLSNRQIATIVKTRDHYYFYLIMVLARRPLTIPELTQMFGKGADLLRVIADFEAAKLASTEASPNPSSSAQHAQVRSISTEMRIPKPTTPDLEEAYRKMNDWDATFSERFEMEKLIDKMMIRRTSLRHLQVLMSFVDSLVDLVRVSDETQAALNNDVILFKVSIYKGRTPG
jgi:transcriptional regulator with XRE-family HTH domain